MAVVLMTGTARNNARQLLTASRYGGVAITTIRVLFGEAEISVPVGHRKTIFRQ